MAMQEHEFQQGLKVIYKVSYVDWVNVGLSPSAWRNFTINRGFWYSDASDEDRQKLFILVHQRVGAVS